MALVAFVQFVRFVVQSGVGVYLRRRTTATAAAMAASSTTRPMDGVSLSPVAASSAVSGVPYSGSNEYVGTNGSSMARYSTWPPSEFMTIQYVSAETE